MQYLPALVAAQPTAPPDDSVVAGPWAFLIFILLVAVIAFLGWSLVRQFRKIDAAKAEGRFDESPADERRRAESGELAGHDAGPGHAGSPADSDHAATGVRQAGPTDQA
jgi:predicted lipid-binding transport protein (Tim44 family)